jgi:ribosome assembly protein YihI (activator of Der GTPase)
MQFLKFLKEYWRDLTPTEVIQRELAQAHLDRLEAEGAVEYAQAVLDLNLNRIERLKTRLGEYK